MFVQGGAKKFPINEIWSNYQTSESILGNVFWVRPITFQHFLYICLCALFTKLSLAQGYKYEALGEDRIHYALVMMVNQTRRTNHYSALFVFVCVFIYMYVCMYAFFVCMWCLMLARVCVWRVDVSVLFIIDISFL